LNIYKEKELDKGTTKRKIGNSDFSTKPTNFYNLDVIISVGYRVKSKQGTQFRIWANGILKEYLLKGYSISNRVFRIEEDIYSLKERVDRIDLQILADHLPKQGIFFQGQIFDAYKFVSDLFRTAEKSIILADNYIDDTVLVHLTKLKAGVQIKIITKSVSDQFRLDIKKFESQYSPVEVKVLKNIHDRFIIIDDEVLYFFGASLKDLGKKLFGFMKMGISELKKVQDNI
jgi:hypothetical protein